MSDDPYKGGVRPRMRVKGMFNFHDEEGNIIESRSFEGEQELDSPEELKEQSNDSDRS